MFRINVERIINKPIGEVFEYLSDHENYSHFPVVDKSELLEQGKDDKNGLGALRRVEIGVTSLEERITLFERPTRLYYLIEKSKPLPFIHDLGEIELFEQGSQTKVIWRSEGHINIPIIGSLVFDKLINKQGAAGFNKILNWIQKQ